MSGAILAARRCFLRLARGHQGFQPINLSTRSFWRGRAQPFDASRPLPLRVNQVRFRVRLQSATGSELQRREQAFRYITAMPHRRGVGWSTPKMPRLALTVFVTCSRSGLSKSARSRWPRACPRSGNEPSAGLRQISFRTRTPPRLGPRQLLQNGRSSGPAGPASPIRGKPGGDDGSHTLPRGSRHCETELRFAHWQMCKHHSRAKALI